jgi:DNA polymerase-1
MEGSKELAALMGAECDECPLQKAPIVYGRGPKPAKYILIGEAPGRTEIRLGAPFVGPSGKLLNRTLDALGIATDDIYVTNAVLCHLPTGWDKQSNLTKARKHCRPRLLSEIKDSGAEVIFAMGRYAAESVLKTDKGITSIRGRLHTSDEFPQPVMPTVHPAAVLRRPDYFEDFRMDFQHVVKPVAEDLTFPVGPETYQVIDDLPTAVSFILGQVAAQSEVVFDLETSGFDMIDDLILCVVFCWSPTEATIITGPVLYRPETIGALGQVFEGKGRTWIGHGAKFDRCFLKAQLGTAPWISFDTLIAHYALDERKGTHDLKVLCRSLFQAPDWEGDLKRYLSKPKTDSYALLPKPVLHRYAAHDGVYTWRLYKHVAKELRKHGKLHNLFRALLMPAQNALADIELYGVAIDEAQAEHLQDTMEAELLDLEGRLAELAEDSDLNPNSPQQVARVLFDKLKLPQIKGRSTNSKDVLPRLKDRHPFAKTLMEHRKTAKLYSTYVTKMPKMLSSDERIHASFMVHGTVTGRLASRGPNLQNIPRESTVKDMFTASRGKVLVMGDYSQAEFRVYGYYSQDPWLVKIFREGMDLHDETTREMFGPNFTKEQRVTGKMVNFGLLYGRTTRALARDMRLPGMTPGKAAAFIKQYFGRMEVGQQWARDTIKRAKAQGYLESVFGRRRRFPLITHSNVGEIERQAVNFMCQSTASDLTLLSLVELHKVFTKTGTANILLTVHDSILAECDEDEMELVAKQIVSVMERIPKQTLGRSMPFTVDVAAGTHWGSLKDITQEVA